MKLKPGDMFFETYEHNGKPSLIVILPNESHFDLTKAETVGDGTGTWEVTGEPPQITVKPSINVESSLMRQGWHGYLTDGMLSEDLEGRTYNLEG